MITEKTIKLGTEMLAEFERLAALDDGKVALRGWLDVISSESARALAMELGARSFDTHKQKDIV